MTNNRNSRDQEVSTDSDFTITSEPIFRSADGNVLVTQDPRNDQFQAQIKLPNSTQFSVKFGDEGVDSVGLSLPSSFGSNRDTTSGGNSSGRSFLNKLSPLSVNIQLGEGGTISVLGFGGGVSFDEDLAEAELRGQLICELAVANDSFIQSEGFISWQYAA